MKVALLIVGVLLMAGTAFSQHSQDIGAKRICIRVGGTVYCFEQ